ncbi:hypothetical protein QVD99_007010 [Batrachochytrium dendrobatidis]|nr:hypothetical protein QVD99_007010 [Batrachochytrium dendrobatidis]
MDRDAYIHSNKAKVDSVITRDKDKSNRTDTLAKSSKTDISQTSNQKDSDTNFKDKYNFDKPPIKLGCEYGIDKIESESAIVSIYPCAVDTLQQQTSATAFPIMGFDTVQSKTIQDTPYSKRSTDRSFQSSTTGMQSIIKDNQTDSDDNELEACTKSLSYSYPKSKSTFSPTESGNACNDRSNDAVEQLHHTLENISKPLKSCQTVHTLSLTSSMNQSNKVPAIPTLNSLALHKHQMYKRSASIGTSFSKSYLASKELLSQSFSESRLSCINQTNSKSLNQKKPSRQEILPTSAQSELPLSDMDAAKSTPSTSSKRIWPAISSILNHTKEKRSQESVDSSSIAGKPPSNNHTKVDHSTKIKPSSSQSFPYSGGRSHQTSNIDRPTSNFADHKQPIRLQRQFTQEETKKREQRAIMLFEYIAQCKHDEREEKKKIMDQYVCLQRVKIAAESERLETKRITREKRKSEQMHQMIRQKRDCLEAIHQQAYKHLSQNRPTPTLTKVPNATECFAFNRYDCSAKEVTCVSNVNVSAPYEDPSIVSESVKDPEHTIDGQKAYHPTRYSSTVSMMSSKSILNSNGSFQNQQKSYSKIIVSGQDQHENTEMRAIMGNKLENRNLGHECISSQALESTSNISQSTHANRPNRLILHEKHQKLSNAPTNSKLHFNSSKIEFNPNTPSKLAVCNSSHLDSSKKLTHHGPRLFKSKFYHKQALDVKALRNQQYQFHHPKYIAQIQHPTSKVKGSLSNMANLNQTSQLMNEAKPFATEQDFLEFKKKYSQSYTLDIPPPAPLSTAIVSNTKSHHRLAQKQIMKDNAVRQRNMIMKSAFGMSSDYEPTPIALQHHENGISHGKLGFETPEPSKPNESVANLKNNGAEQLNDSRLSRSNQSSQYSPSHRSSMLHTGGMLSDINVNLDSLNSLGKDRSINQFMPEEFQPNVSNDSSSPYSSQHNKTPKGWAILKQSIKFADRKPDFLPDSHFSTSSRSLSNVSASALSCFTPERRASFVHSGSNSPMNLEKFRNSGDANGKYTYILKSSSYTSMDDEARELIREQERVERHIEDLTMAGLAGGRRGSIYKQSCIALTSDRKGSGTNSMVWRSKSAGLNVTTVEENQSSQSEDIVESIEPNVKDVESSSLLADNLQETFIENTEPTSPDEPKSPECMKANIQDLNIEHDCITPLPVDHDSLNTLLHSSIPKNKISTLKIYNSSSRVTSGQPNSIGDHENEPSVSSEPFMDSISIYSTAYAKNDGEFTLSKPNLIHEAIQEIGSHQAFCAPLVGILKKNTDTGLAEPDKLEASIQCVSTTQSSNSDVFQISENRALAANSLHPLACPKMTWSHLGMSAVAEFGKTLLPTKYVHEFKIHTTSTNILGDIDQPNALEQQRRVKPNSLFAAKAAENDAYMSCLKKVASVNLNFDKKQKSCFDPLLCKSDILADQTSANKKPRAIRPWDGVRMKISDMPLDIGFDLATNENGKVKEKPSLVLQNVRFWNPKIE